MSRITIPKPCHQDWNDMTPTTQGAFCSACAKEVVDFTTMTDDEVKHYLLQRNGDRVCGKFRNDQIERVRISIPASVFYSRVAAWKRYLAILLITFGSILFGCDVTTKGKVNFGEQQIQEHQLMGDTVMGIERKRGMMFSIDSMIRSQTETSITMGVMMCPVTTVGDVQVHPDTVETIVVQKEDATFMGIPELPTDTLPAADSSKKGLPAQPKTKLPADSTCREQHFY